jgi:amino acid transporter
MLLLLTNGFSVFIHDNWSTAGFITSYIDIPLVAAAYVLWKIIKKTKWVALKDIPIEEVLLGIEIEESRGDGMTEERKRGWWRWISWIWD